MLEGIEKRATEEARYLAAGGCTVRQTAQAFGVSKSTVYKDLTERLPHLDEAALPAHPPCWTATKRSATCVAGGRRRKNFEVKNWRKLPENNLPKRGTCGRKTPFSREYIPMCDGKNSSNLLLPKRRLDIEGMRLRILEREIFHERFYAGYRHRFGHGFRAGVYKGQGNCAAGAVGCGGGRNDPYHHRRRNRRAQYAGAHAARHFRYSPLENGVISDYDLTERMIHYYLKQVLGRFSFARPRVVVCVPSGVTELERRSVVEATMDAGLDGYAPD